MITRTEINSKDYNIYRLSTQPRRYKKYGFDTEYEKKYYLKLTDWHKVYRTLFFSITEELFGMNEKECCLIYGSETLEAMSYDIGDAYNIYIKDRISDAYTYVLIPKDNTEFNSFFLNNIPELFKIKTMKRSPMSFMWNDANFNTREMGYDFSRMLYESINN